MPDPPSPGKQPAAPEASAPRTGGPEPGDLPSKMEGPTGKGSQEAGELTPEEQLARYEEALKNDDWGHQPC